MKDCLFCRIIEREISSEIIAEDERTLTVLDVHPRAEGHALVLPKRHVYAILDLSDEEVGEVFRAVKRTTALLKEKLHPDGFTIGINHGETAGQAIEHLHVHVIPRWADDGGGSLHSVVNNPPAATPEQVAKKIRS